MVSFDEEQVDAGRYGPSVELAWKAVSSLYEEAVKPPVSWCRAEVEHELLFCLMGGFGVSYEHGRTASEIVWQLEPFSEELEDCELFDIISSALMRPQFGPPKADGTLRRYRYPFQEGFHYRQSSQLVAVQQASPRTTVRIRQLSGTSGTPHWLPRNRNEDSELAAQKFGLGNRTSHHRHSRLSGVSRDWTNPHQYSTAPRLRNCGEGFP